MDAIIVTPIHLFKEIYSILKQKRDTQILELEHLLDKATLNSSVEIVENDNCKINKGKLE